MEIKYRDPKELEKMFAEYNPRRISEFELEKLKRSIKVFGFIVPVLINTKTNRVVSGHQRITAAIELNLKEVPTIETTIESEEDEKILNVAMNRIKGKFDAEKLDRLFRRLVEKHHETDITGFDSVDIMEMREVLYKDEKKAFDFEQFIFHVPKKDVSKVREALTAAKGMPEKMAEIKKENGNSNACAITILAQEYLKQ